MLSLGGPFHIAWKTLLLHYLFLFLTPFDGLLAITREGVSNFPRVETKLACQDHHPILMLLRGRVADNEVGSDG